MKVQKCMTNQYVMSTEVRSEIFSSESKAQSSDRAMDLGLAEDHFSRPVVSRQPAFNLFECYLM